MEIFIEPNLPKPTLLIVGDSPVATSLATLGPLLGYRVVLVAPGVEASELPDVDVLVSDLDALAPYLSPSTYAVVASMGKYDETALGQVARGPVAFAGLVASRKRAQSVFATLREEGVTAAQLARVRNPVGIDLAATTPEEISPQHHGGDHPGPAHGDDLPRGRGPGHILGSRGRDRPGLSDGGRADEPAAHRPRRNDLLLLFGSVPPKVRSVPGEVSCLTCPPGSGR